MEIAMLVKRHRIYVILMSEIDVAQSGHKKIYT